jgi:hypothetical protein
MAVKIKATQVVHGSSWDQTTIEEIEIDELDVQLSELEKLRAKADHYKLLYEEQMARVIDTMEAREEKTHISALDGGRQATVVYGETVVYDDAAILAAVNPRVAEVISERRIKREKLEQAVLRGLVNPEIIADNATVKPRKPFVRITEHRESEPEG